MKMHYKALMLSLALGLSSCGGNTTTTQTNEEPTPEQEELIQNGWSSNTPEGGELGTEYGIKPIYGIQDNYFDIRIGEGFSVAIKIVDASSEKCIRYVYVPEGESITVSQIPQGRYYLKLAYGKDWMELSDGVTVKGKFTRSPFYEKSASSYDFGKKNSQSFVNYSLELNVINGDTENNFETVAISEEEFNQN